MAVLVEEGNFISRSVEKGTYGIHVEMISCAVRRCQVLLTNLNKIVKPQTKITEQLIMVHRKLSMPDECVIDLAIRGVCQQSTY